MAVLPFLLYFCNCFGHRKKHCTKRPRKHAILTLKSPKNFRDCLLLRTLFQWGGGYPLPTTYPEGASTRLAHLAFDMPLPNFNSWIRLWWFTCPQTVTHPSTNLARRRLTSLIGWNALPCYRYDAPSFQIASGQPLCSTHITREIWECLP